MKKAVILLCLFAFMITACGEKPQTAEISKEEEKPAAVNPTEEKDTQQEVQEESIPAENASVPEFFPWGCEDFSVDEGTEVGFYYFWGSKTEDQNSDYFNAAAHHVTLNGVPVKILNDGIGDVEYDDEGNPKHQYWAVIGDFPAGTYEVVNTIEITEPVFDGWDWYGPDSDYPTLQSSCTMTVGGGSTAEVKAPTAAPASTCPIDSPIREEWDTVVCETFDSDTILWTGNQDGTSARVQGGEYILDNSTKVEQGYKTGFIFPVFAGSAPDHMISVDGTMDSNYQGCTWGVFVRSLSNEIVYFFMINNSGRYTLTGSTDRESSRYLGNIDSGSNNAIVWDGSNNITAVADGKQLEFYVNGELVATHEAVTSENPNFGLIVWGGEGVTAVNHFDNLLVRAK